MFGIRETSATSRITRVSRISELIRPFLAGPDGGDGEKRREREVPKAGRMRYVVGGKKTKRSLGGPPWNRVLLVFAAASSVPVGALGARRSRGRRNGQIDTVFCFK